MFPRFRLRRTHPPQSAVETAPLLRVQPEVYETSRPCERGLPSSASPRGRACPEAACVLSGHQQVRHAIGSVHTHRATAGRRMVSTLSRVTKQALTVLRGRQWLGGQPRSLSDGIKLTHKHQRVLQKSN